jgi:hypothetical protein
MDRCEIPHDQWHLGVQSGVFKMISKPNGSLAQTVHYLASRLALSPNGLKRAFTRTSSPRSTISGVQSNFWAFGTFGTNRAPIMPQDLHYLQTDRNELPLEPRHLGVPSGVSKMIFELIVCLAQCFQLSYTNTKTVSKWTDARFHMIRDT